jgi:hypothetical protein
MEKPRLKEAEPPELLAAGFQAAYGLYRGTNTLRVNNEIRRIMDGNIRLDPAWLRLANAVIAATVQPPLDFDIRIVAGDTAK